MAALLYLFLHPISRLIHLKWGVLQEPHMAISLFLLYCRFLNTDVPARLVDSRRIKISAGSFSYSINSATIHFMYKVSLITLAQRILVLRILIQRAGGFNSEVRFPRFFVFQEVGFMLPVSLSVE